MPLVFGGARFYAHGDPNPKPTGKFSREPPLYNVLDAITDLTPAIRRELTPDELNYILQLFFLGVEVSHLVHRRSKNAEEALRYLGEQHGLPDIEGIPHPLRMFARDDHFTSRAPKWPIATGHFSYARSFKWVFFFFAAMGLILGGWALVWSLP